MGKVIALSGWKGSGKDFGAEYLRDTHGYHRLALADILKDQVSTLFNVPRSILDDRVGKEQGIATLPVRPADTFTRVVQELLKAELVTGSWTPRAICILIGSVFRSVDPDYWVNMIINTIKDAPQYNYVITDIRYRNELQVLGSAFPNLLAARVERVASPGTMEASENDLNDWKFPVVLDNRGRAADYYSQLDLLVDDTSVGRMVDGSYIQYGE